MIFLNGKLLAAGAANVSPFGDGFQFGAGVFTTIRVSAGRAEFLGEHFERLSGDARAIGLAAGTTEVQWRERCAACIAANRIEEGGLKAIWFADGEGRTSEIISQRPHSYRADTYARGFRLTARNCAGRATRDLARHKTLNCLEHVQAKRAALAAGFDEAVWIDERGIALEGTTTNIFAVVRGEAITTVETAGLLPGIARRVVLGLASVPAMRVGELTREMIAEADEVFVTNALMGVMPVCALDGRSYDVGNNPITRAIAAAFFEQAKTR